MNNTAHDSWAEVYDDIYRENYGSSYQRLTRITLAAIRAQTDPPARIVDFGAGTGRLSLPLASEGYSVTAVEPSGGMLERLKAQDPESKIATRQCLIQDFKPNGDFDLALCLFTVLLYLTDWDSLEKSLRIAYDSLRPGGKLLLDIPMQVAFKSQNKTTARMQRRVTVAALGDGLYNYIEDTVIDGRNFHDSFPIRHWPQAEVLEVLRGLGFENSIPQHQIQGTGSNYFVFRKNSQI